MNIGSKNLKMRFSSPEDKDLMIRAAWLYFIEKLTQREIGEILGVSRVKVTRLISKGWEENEIHVEITHSMTKCLELEKKLIQKFNLKNAVVVPLPYSLEKLKVFLGKGAAQFLDQTIKDGQILTVAWGTTLSQTAKQVKIRNLANLKVFPVSGAICPQSKGNPYEVIGILEERLGAQTHYIPAPALADSVQSKNVIISQKDIFNTLKMAKKADIILVGVGSVNFETTLVKAGLLKKEEIQHLQSLGAKAEIIAHFINENGEIVDKDYSERVIGLNLSDLKNSKCTVCVAGGREKIDAIRVVLNNHLAKIIVTDERTAKNLVLHSS